MVNALSLHLIQNFLYMKAIRFFMLAGVLFASLQVYAQKVKITEGKIDALKGVTKLNVAYDYSRMAVGKFENESDYLAQKKEEYNKKEAGRGDSWEKAWKADRSNLFAPKFEELFTKYSDIQLAQGYDQPYTIILKTTFTEPGYDIYVSKKNAEIDAIALIVESKNPAVVIAKIAIENAPGRTYTGNNYDTGVRLQEAYAAAGKALGKFLKSQAK
jgi:hypothetical protein